MSFNKGKAMADEEEKMYVAVSKEIKENRSILTWALQNSGGKQLCIIHVHQPAKRIATPIGFMPANAMDELEVKAFRDKEREEMSVILDEYLRICQKSGVRVEKLYVEAYSIEKGIIQLIEQHSIRKLVIGSAADKHYSRKMTEVKSQKAIYVKENAPPCCHIWFICKGYLIHTRGAISTPKSGGEENSPVNDERHGVAVSPTAPPFDTYDLTPPRWSTDSFDGSVSRSGSARDFAAGRPSLSAPMHPQSMLRNESVKAAGLESLFMEECMRRKEAETELAKVREELEWMKTHMTALPRKNEELETTELDKVKAELEYMKNNVMGELRSAVEQKALLENQIRNANFLLQMLGEKLTSAINVVYKHDER